MLFVHGSVTIWVAGKMLVMTWKENSVLGGEIHSSSPLWLLNHIGALFGLSKWCVSLLGAISGSNLTLLMPYMSNQIWSHFSQSSALCDGKITQIIGLSESASHTFVILPSFKPY